MYLIFPKGDLIGTCTQDFCCKQWGDSNMQLHCFILLVAHLNFIIYLHGANMGLNKLVIVCCQMCVWMQHNKLCFRLWLIQLGLCPSHMPLDSANQCPTVEKKVTDRRRICRQSIENKITLLWLLQDHVLIKKTSKKQTNTWWNRCIQVWFIRWLELTGLQLKQTSILFSVHTCYTCKHRATFL